MWLYIYCFFWTPFLQLLGYLTLYIMDMPYFFKTKVSSNKAKTVRLVYKPLNHLGQFRGVPFKRRTWYFLPKLLLISVLVVFSFVSSVN